MIRDGVAAEKRVAGVLATSFGCPYEGRVPLDRVLQVAKEIPLGLHFHNTRGLGLANALAGFEAGVRRFDAANASLGGCPFAPPAVGNVCTEDLVHMFHQMGEETGTDLQQLIDHVRWMEQVMEKPLDGMLMKAGIATF